MTLGQAQHLLKPKLITELKKRGIECSDDDNRDVLREKLVGIVRKEIEEAKAAKVAVENPPESEKVKLEKVGNTETDSIGSYDTTGKAESVASSENARSADADSDDDMAGKAKIEFKLNTDD